MCAKCTSFGIICEAADYGVLYEYIYTTIGIKCIHNTFHKLSTICESMDLSVYVETPSNIWDIDIISYVPYTRHIKLQPFYKECKRNYLVNIYYVLFTV